MSININMFILSIEAYYEIAHLFLLYRSLQLSFIL